MIVDRLFIAFYIVITALVVVVVGGFVGSVAGAAVFEHQVTQEGIAHIRAARGLSEEAARDAYLRPYRVNRDGWPYKNAVEHGALFGAFTGFWLYVILLLVVGYVWLGRNSLDTKVSRPKPGGKSDATLPQAQSIHEPGDEEIETFEEL